MANNQFSFTNLYMFVCFLPHQGSVVVVGTYLYCHVSICKKIGIMQSTLIKKKLLATDQYQFVHQYIVHSLWNTGQTLQLIGW